MKQQASSDLDKVYNTVKDYFKENYHIDWLKPLGFKNTYILAVKQDLVSKYNINTISDLAKVSSNLNLGCTTDGYPGLKKMYNLNFNSVKGIDGGLRYSALLEDSTQVLDTFSTDGLLEKFKLKLLKDDKKFFYPIMQFQ